MMLKRIRRWFEGGRPAPAHEPESPADGAGRELVDRFAASRAKVLEHVVDANRVTESETLAVGDNLRSIVELTEAHLSQMREAVERLGSTGGENIVSDAMREQSEATSAFVRDLLGMLGELGKVAATASERSGNIAKIARDITAIAQAAKMLSLNTKVEAARLGKGSSFGVIASEMKRLSDSVQLANGRVSELAQNLSGEIGAIALASQEMITSTESFSGAQSERLGRVAEVSVELRSALHEIVGAGDAHDARMVKDLHDALSHLQFQDPVAQRLLRVDAVLRDFQKAVAEAFDVELSEEELSIAHFEVGGGVDVDGPDPGEVTLF